MTDLGRLVGVVIIVTGVGIFGTCFWPTAAGIRS